MLEWEIMVKSGYASGRLTLLKLVCLVAGIFTLAGISLSCSPQPYSGPVESVVVSYSPFESTAFLWIADNQGFFRQNGLDISMRKYDTGAGSLDGMLKGEADIALGITEFPLTRKALQKVKVRIIAGIDKSEFIYVIARKDRGIEKASDLRGKRVGTTLGTIAEFHLGRFLELNGMSMKDIVLVDVKTPAAWVNAVVDGDIDAIATAQPYANSAREGLGTNAIFWPAQAGQSQYALISTTDKWITEHPQLVKRFLKSMLQAEEYLIRNPVKAKAIVQERLNLNPAYVEKFWSQNQFSLSLDQGLILAMEDEARWMISNNLTTERVVPNFLDYIDESALKAVKPKGVKLIR